MTLRLAFLVLALLPLGLPGQRPGARAVPRHLLLQYVGRYQQGTDAPVVVALRGDTLVLRRERESDRALVPTSDSTFVDTRGGRVAFARDVVGRVTGVQVGRGAPTIARVYTTSVPDSLNAAVGGRRVPDGLTVERVEGPTGDTISFPSRPFTLRGVVWRPGTAGPHPAVLLLHGSGGCFDGRPEDYQVGRWLAARGYVALLGCRRGQGLSRGQGRSVLQQLEALALPRGSAEANARMTALLETEQVDDVRASLAALRAMSDVDTSRVAVMGLSFGGILTLLSAEKVEGLRAAVSFAPAAMNWRVNQALRERVLEAGRRARVPVLVVQAEGDFDMGPVVDIPAAMRAAGRPVEARVFPALSDSAGAGHGLMLVAPSAWGPEVLAFLDRTMPAR
ncbi:MAG TPA: dienelactone hydrolase family protein [Gemmatimonadaceae bacterium]|nr:dienelactone hydrolase family protein [Gemmatimonadaceae bacterium]